MILKNFLLNDSNRLNETVTESFLNNSKVLFEIPTVMNEIWFDNLKMLMTGTNLAVMHKNTTADSNCEDSFIVDYAKEKLENLNLTSKLHEIENELINSKIEILELTKQKEDMQKKEKYLNAKLEKEQLINNNLSTQFGILECELSSVKKEWSEIEQKMMENESSLRKKIKEISENNSGLNSEIDNLKNSLATSEKILTEKSALSKEKDTKSNMAKDTPAKACSVSSTKKSNVSEKELAMADASTSKMSTKKSNVNNAINSASENKNLKLALENSLEQSLIVSDAFSKLNNVTVLPLREDTKE